MNILLIAGHGEGDSGAVGCGYRECDLAREIVPMIQKSLLDRYIVNAAVFNMKQSMIHQVGTLKKSYNFKPYDYVLEVHFNSAANDIKGNGKTTGSEMLVTSYEKVISTEKAILNNLSNLGMRNRGVKARDDLYVISYAKRQGVSSALLEVCFIDDKDDINLYQAKKNELADAIADGIAEGYKLNKKPNKPIQKPNKPIQKPPETQSCVDTPSEWAKSAWEKAVSKGIIDGTNPRGACTREQIITILDRLRQF